MRGKDSSFEGKQEAPHGSRLPCAVVIKMDSLPGFQAARILKKYKIPVIGLVKNLNDFRSRGCSRDNLHKMNYDSGKFVDLMKSIGASLDQKAVLYPCCDSSVLLVSRNRRELRKWFLFALPDENTLETLVDKSRFYAFAMKEGFPVPRTFFLTSRSEARKAAEQLNYPCILKPPLRGPSWAPAEKKKVLRLDDADQLMDAYDRTSTTLDLLIAQDWVEGDDSELYSMNCYFSANSEPLVTFIAKKLRQYPPRTGVSCLGVEVRNDFVLEESVRMFKHVNFRGLGYVEMKSDRRTGKHYIIEPNIGRPTGRSAIAEAAGVELLYTMYCDLVGLPLPENRNQKYTGVKWIYVRKDLQSAWYYWREGELTLKEWWHSIRGRKAYAVFSWSDPVPFLADFVSVLLRKVRRFFGKGRR